MMKPTAEQPYRGWVRDTKAGDPYLDARCEDFEALWRRADAPGKADRTAGGVSLRRSMPPIQDQGELQSCTAHALAAVMGFLHSGRRISRLHLYFLSRRLSGAPYKDGGAKLKDAVRALHETGVVMEDDWNYDPSKLIDQPGRAVAGTAEHNRIRRFARLSGGGEFRRCLDSGHPFVIGMEHTDAFWSAATEASGVVPKPSESEDLSHAHAVCVIGYANPCQRARQYLPDAARNSHELHYEIRNSAGADWGDAGHFWVPAGYLEDPALCGDAWTVWD